MGVCSPAGAIVGHLPHQLLVVEGQWGLPAEDVHLALEDRHLHSPFHALLGLGDAVADEFTLRAVPETCSGDKVRVLGWPTALGYRTPQPIMVDLGGGSALFTAESRHDAHLWHKPAGLACGPAGLLWVRRYPCHGQEEGSYNPLPQTRHSGSTTGQALGTRR